MISRFLKKRGVNSIAFLIGMGISGLYYLIVHLPFMEHSVLHAYTTHHVTEYAIVMLFFWACAEHLVCFVKGTRERTAVGRVSLPERHGLEEVEQTEVLLAHLRVEHFRDSSSMMYQRIQTALRFVHEGQSVEGFREYLESLEARDSNQVFERYGFSRFVTTILPILGLIGTVVHFGAALTGLSMDGLTEKLPKMLSSMGTAFNTTFTAMTCMVVTFLVRFLVERRDNELLRKIDAYLEDELLHRFQSIDAATKKVTDLLTVSNSTLMASLVSFELKLIDEWNNRLDIAQRRWEELDQRQELNLIHFLRMVERQQESHVNAVKQWAENLSLPQQSRQLEDAIKDLTAAIELSSAKQNGVPSIRLAS